MKGHAPFCMVALKFPSRARYRRGVCGDCDGSCLTGQVFGSPAGEAEEGQLPLLRWPRAEPALKVSLAVSRGGNCDGRCQSDLV